VWRKISCFGAELVVLAQSQWIKQKISCFKKTVALEKKSVALKKKQFL
jgi:hypothetical protein